MDEFEKALQDSRREFGDHECGHCGHMLDLQMIDFGSSKRTLCLSCIAEILHWI